MPRILLLSLIWAWAAQLCFAQQTAEAFFIPGAKNYIKNQVAEARSIVDQGLKLFPEDKRLLELDKLLKQQQQDKQDQNDKKDEEKQDQKDQQKKDEQKQDQQKDDQQKQDQQKQDQQKSEEEQKKQQEAEQKKKEQEQQQQQQKEQEQAKSADKKEEPQGDQKDRQAASMARAIPMTAQEAQRLLDTLKREEKAMIFIPQVRTNRNDRVLKDW